MMYITGEQFQWNYHNWNSDVLLCLFHFIVNVGVYFLLKKEYFFEAQLAFATEILKIAEGNCF